jgi:ABC-type uncharacterized transport system substrate-binding protein
MQFSQNRREFITLIGGAAAAWPLAARAQQPDRVRRIGVLMGVSEDDPETKARVAAFRWGLERRGWLEGRNLHLDYRFTAARGERLPALAKELVALQPDVILAHSTGAAVELQRESHTIPIVFVNASDPIGSGFVASLARPGRQSHRRAAPRSKHRRQVAGDAQGDCAAPHPRCAHGEPQDVHP